MKLKVLDLFAGIGGFSLGLERTGGFETVAFCEIDKKAQKVLKKHWPDVPVFDDVKGVNAETLNAVGIRPDVITGGFPCQDISTAGKGAGLAGERSGLWFEMLRIIQETKPQYAIIENVSSLRSRGLEVVLGGLAEIGYDAEWHCIPASAVGAPHQRDRIWIVGHPGVELQHIMFNASGTEGSRSSSSSRTLDISNSSGCIVSPHSHKFGTQVSHQGGFSAEQVFGSESKEGGITGGSFWSVEPNVGRVANGVPGRVDRLKQLGNAVVPQIPELIGKAILRHNS